MDISDQLSQKSSDIDGGFLGLTNHEHYMVESFFRKSIWTDVNDKK